MAQNEENSSAGPFFDTCGVQQMVIGIRDLKYWARGPFGCGGRRRLRATTRITDAARLSVIVCPGSQHDSFQKLGACILGTRSHNKDHCVLETPACFCGKGSYKANTHTHTLLFVGSVKILYRIFWFLDSDPTKVGSTA